MEEILIMLVSKNKNKKLKCLLIKIVKLMCFALELAHQSLIKYYLINKVPKSNIFFAQNFGQTFSKFFVFRLFTIFLHEIIGFPINRISYSSFASTNIIYILNHSLVD